MKLEPTPIFLPEDNKLKNQNKDQKNDSIFVNIFPLSIFPNQNQTRYGISTNIGLSIYDCVNNNLKFNYEETHDLLKVS